MRSGAHLAANKFGQPILGLIFLRYADILYKQNKEEIENEYNSLKGEYLSSTETNMRASTSYGDTVDVMSFSFSSNRGFYTSKGVDRNVRAILAF